MALPDKEYVVLFSIKQMALEESGNNTDLIQRPYRAEKLLSSVCSFVHILSLLFSFLSLLPCGLSLCQKLPFAYGTLINCHISQSLFGNSKLMSTYFVSIPDTHGAEHNALMLG